MEKPQTLARPDIPELYSPDNILSIELQVQQKVCDKTLQLAEKYLENGETISTFNRNFMNEMLKADPEKFKISLLQERGMSIGITTSIEYAKAFKYFSTSNEQNFKDRLTAIEKTTKRVIDLVFTGQCSLADIQKGREILKTAGWTQEGKADLVEGGQ
jgi:hypothetical protein